MDLLSLSPEQFESMTFDIVTALGLRNAVWRTPGSDVGRDIEGNYYISDLSGLYQKQKWYVECKRYAKSVDWPTVWNKIAYAETHSAD
ncbi:TPA: restriction endonuclease, partial [Vibrio cholerae]|nr:restriction endonuclease [Vibrio cholerae]